MAEVSIVHCKDYSEPEVRRALREVLEPVGGLDWVREGMTVAIKANLVMPGKPEKAVTTHPALLRELTLMLKEKGARVIIGDSPGGPFIQSYLNKVYQVSGLDICEEAGAELNRNVGDTEVSYPEARAAKTFKCTNYLLEADAIIDFCKLKSHGMMSLSAAVKNMFGAVPGTVKPEYHFRYPDPMVFADMLIDLNDYLKPCLYIVDAVTAMEGNGPTSGTPKHMGALLAGKNPHKLDMACVKIMNLGYEFVPTLMRAVEYGLTPALTDEIDISGNIDEFVVEDFERIENHRSNLFVSDKPGLINRLKGPFIKKALESKPAVTKKECVGCKQCFNVCPAKAIEMVNKKPVIDRSKCIKCFCCQEFCPVGAMKVKRTAIAKLLVK